MKLIIKTILIFLISLSGFSEEYTVKNSAELAKVSSSLKPGDIVTLLEGIYSGGVSLRNIKGSKEAPITIVGKGIEKTIFSKGKQALHLINCHNLILKNFSIKKFTINGLNADDGGSQTNPPIGLVFENISVTDIGPKGNNDGFKFSGLHEFRVKNCYFSGWGGSAVDMVGCHNGAIEKSVFEGKENFSQNTGIQMKGGTANIKVAGNTFIKAGQRAINLGGSTGLEWFRPKGANYEAKNIEISGNTFKGGMAHIAFVTSQNNRVHHNTFYKADKWFFRILQETKDPHFIKSQSSTIDSNIFVFDKSVRTFINIGSGTLPATFTFKQNLWKDVEGKRKPKLPVKEIKGLYNPEIKLQENKGGSFQYSESFSVNGPQGLLK